MIPTSKLEPSPREAFGRALGFATRNRWRIAVALIVLAALWVRWARSSFGLPYLHHWDEYLVASKALEMLKSGDWNPHEFWYGSLLMYLNMALDAVHLLGLSQIDASGAEVAARLADVKTGLETGWTWTVSHPSFYLANRRLTAAFGTGCVACVAHLGWRFSGPRLGLLAAAGLAFAHTHVEHSSFVTTDVPSLFFFLLAACFAVELARHRRLGWLAASAAAVGAGASIKYNVALAGLIPALTVLLLWRELTPRQRWQAAALLLFVPALVFLAGTPYALLDSPQFLDHLAFNLRTYKVLGHTQSTSEPGWPNFRSQLETLVHTTPAWMVALSPLGLAALSRRRPSWPFLLASAAYLYSMADMRIAFHRNFLLLYPLVALGGAAAIDELVRRLRAEPAQAPAIPRWRRGLAYAALALAAVGLALEARAEGRDALAFGRRVENRSEIVDRLRSLAATHGWQRIGWAGELHEHPLDLARLGLESSELPLQDLLCAVRRFDAVVLPTAVGSLGRNAVLEARAAELRERLRLVPARLRIAGDVTSINVFSVNPGLQVVASADAAPRALCGRVDLVLLGSAKVRRRPNYAFSLPAGVEAPHVTVWLPAGRYELVWRIAPATAEAVSAEVTVAVDGVTGDTMTAGRLGEARFRLKPGKTRRTLTLDLERDGEVRVRWVAGALPASLASGQPLAEVEGVHLRPL